jgi:hypothetical protein
MTSRDCDPEEHLIILLLASSVLLFALVAIAAFGRGELAIDGPLCIEGAVTWSNDTVVIRSEVRVMANGSLLVRDSTLIFDNKTAMRAGITVEPGGSLIVMGDSMGSHLMRGQSYQPYFLRAYQGTTLRISDSRIDGLGQVPTVVSLWEAGNCIRCDDATITGCTFSDSFCGIGFEGVSSGTVTCCEFRNCSRGVWLRACTNLIISDSSFIGCSHGIDADDFSTTARTGCSIRGCLFIGGLFGLTFKGRSLEVADSHFTGHDRALLVNGADWCDIVNATVIESRIGIRLSSVESALLRGLRIDGAEIGLACIKSRILLEDSSITNTTDAIDSQEGQLAVYSTTLSAHANGISYWGHGPSSSEGADLRLDGIAFSVPGFAIYVDGATLASVQGCRFLPDSVSQSFANVSNLEIVNTSFDAGMATLCRAVGMGSLELSQFVGAGASFNLTNSTMSIGPKNTFQWPASLVLDVKSRGLSHIPPESFQLEILDELSEFEWVKDLSVNVTLASDGQPAMGCQLRLLDAGHMEVGQAWLDRRGGASFETVAVTRLTTTGQTRLTPHTIACTLGIICQDQAFDLSAGGKSTVAIDIRLDDVPPGIQVSAPTDKAINVGGCLHTRGSVTDEFGGISSVELILDDSPALMVGQSWDETLPVSIGWHVLQVRAADDHGNVASVYTWFRLVEPLVPIEISTPSNGSLTNSTGIRIAGKVPGASWLFVNSIEAILTDGGGFSTEVPLAEGANDVTFEYGTDFERKTFHLLAWRDSAPPTFTIEEVPRITNHTPLIILGRVRDDHSPAQVWVGGELVATEGDGTFRASLRLGDGEHHILLWATDLAGNYGSLSLTVTIDTGIELRLLGSVPDATTDRVIHVSLSSEKGSALEVVVNGAHVGNHSFLSDILDLWIQLPSAGSNQIRLTACDEAGNSRSLELNVTYSEEFSGSIPSGWHHIATSVGIVFSVVAALAIASLIWRRKSDQT